MSKQHPDQPNEDRGAAMSTVQQVADRLQMKPSWVYAQASAGKIPGAVKLGKYWRFNPQKLDRWLSK